MNITTPSALKYAKVLVFAPPGHGKTTLLGTAQEDDRTSPTLIVDFEAGTESLDGLDVDIAPIHSWKDSDEVLEMLESGDHDYKSVGIDSISEWNVWAQLERLRLKGPGRNDPDLIELQDYNVTGVQLRRVLRRYRDLPLHVFMSGHAKTIDEPRVGRVTVPKLSGALSDDIAGLVSVVGYLAKDEEDERLLILHGYKQFRTKVRASWFKDVPEDIENPDVTELLDVLNYKHDGRKQSTR